MNIRVTVVAVVTVAAIAALAVLGPWRQGSSEAAPRCDGPNPPSSCGTPPLEPTATPGPVSASIIGGGVTGPQFTGQLSYSTIFRDFAEIQPESRILQTMPVMGTVSGLRVRVSVPMTQGSWTFVLRKNQTDTLITCVIVVQECADLVNSATFSDGDHISLEIIPSGLSPFVDPRPQPGFASLSWTAKFVPGP